MKRGYTEIGISSFHLVQIIYKNYTKAYHKSNEHTYFFFQKFKLVHKITSFHIVQTRVASILNQQMVCPSRKKVLECHHPAFQSNLACTARGNHDVKII